jgi:predicted ATPase
VIIEDIHWSDVDTIEALGHLARRLRTSPMLLVLTHRSEEVPLEHPLRALRRALLAENRALMRSLSPLKPDDVAQLATATLRGANADISASVARASGGNPLFALQMLHHYAEAGDVQSTGSELDSLVASRLERLNEDTRALLSLGALIDLHFTVEELAQVSGHSEDAVLASVDTLLDARYVKWSAAPGFTLTFAHQ